MFISKACQPESDKCMSPQVMESCLFSLHLAIHMPQTKDLWPGQLRLLQHYLKHIRLVGKYFARGIISFLFFSGKESVEEM